MKLSYIWLPEGEWFHEIFAIYRDETKYDLCDLTAVYKWHVDSRIENALLCFDGILFQIDIWDMKTESNPRNFAFVLLYAGLSIFKANPMTSFYKFYTWPEYTKRTLAKLKISKKKC